ncbi:MAG: 4Fe-4S binding protein [Acidobacteriota bacterium]|jgi:formate hydrogenlyase subunit 6/NADH:ubiquinone oxidoreductase subunit I|nr:4Fe-4S binding protein [Acidobacteriota bacterium]
MKKPGKMLAELLRHVTKRPATTQYPFKKIDVPATYRGRIVFISENCIGCKLCMRDCPASAITINKVGEEKIFEAVFDLDKCIYCAQCVLSCNKKALMTSTDFELAQITRKNLRMVYDAKPKPPAPPKEPVVAPPADAGAAPASPQA